MTKWLLVLLPFLLVQTSRGAAVEEPRDIGREAMKALPSLAGRWEGGGSIRQGAGEPVRFVGEERVESKLEGRILVIEGKHWSADRSRVIHHAFAVLSYDPEKQGYRFQTHLENGRGGDFRGHLEDGAFVWEMDNPTGRIRFVIRVEGERWHEVGKIEREGKWHQFFEMDLRRVGS
jgi:hypothetical protein